VSQNHALIRCTRYQTLKKRGLLHQYETESDPTRPILDQDIASAIESLQSSTTAIEEQCRVLELQKDALIRLKALDKPNLDAEYARNERRRKEGQEKARLDVAVSHTNKHREPPSDSLRLTTSPRRSKSN
jgi:hypothetical protein